MSVYFVSSPWLRSADEIRQSDAPSELIVDEAARKKPWERLTKPARA